MGYMLGAGGKAKEETPDSSGGNNVGLPQGGFDLNHNFNHYSERLGLIM